MDSPPRAAWLDPHHTGLFRSHLGDSGKVASQVADIGHGCETLAFVMNHAVLRKDATLFKAASEAFERHVTVAKDTYHHPRQLMVSLLAIERMIGRKKIPSGIFG